jgi:hypothetical protein
MKEKNVVFKMPNRYKNAEFDADLEYSKKVAKNWAQKSFSEKWQKNGLFDFCAKVFGH